MVSTKRTREEQLIENAIELFSQGGYPETSLGDIADKLNITRPLFYYYFESKEDLLWRIIGRLGDDLLERARPVAASDLDTTSKMEELLIGHADTILRNVKAFRIYFAERHMLTGTRHRSIRRGELAYHELLESVIAEGQASGVFKVTDPWLQTQLVTGMANALVRWFEPNGRLPLSSLLAAYSEGAMAVLRASK